MSGFDIIILIILLYAFIRGYRKGLIRMLIGLAIIILAAVFGGRLAAVFLPGINKVLSISPQWTNVLSYIAAFLLIATVLTFVGKLIHNIFTAINLGFLNRMAGGLISIGSTMFILSILFNLLIILDSEQKLIKPDTKENSFFYDRVQLVIPAVVPYLKSDSLDEILPENIKKQVDDTLDKIIENSELNNVIDSTYQNRYFETE